MSCPRCGEPLDEAGFCSNCSWSKPILKLTVKDRAFLRGAFISPD